jgi:hypothetical protein
MKYFKITIQVFYFIKLELYVISYIYLCNILDIIINKIQYKLHGASIKNLDNKSE